MGSAAYLLCRTETATIRQQPLNFPGRRSSLSSSRHRQTFSPAAGACSACRHFAFHTMNDVMETRKPSVGKRWRARGNASPSLRYGAMVHPRVRASALLTTAATGEGISSGAAPICRQKRTCGSGQQQAVCTDRATARSVCDCSSAHDRPSPLSTPEWPESALAPGPLRDVPLLQTGSEKGSMVSVSRGMISILSYRSTGLAPGIISNCLLSPFGFLKASSRKGLLARKISCALPRPNG